MTKKKTSDFPFEYLMNINDMKTNLNHVIVAGVAILSFAFPRLGHATNYDWNVTSGDAATASNWNPTAPFTAITGGVQDTAADQYSDGNGGSLTLSSILNISSSKFYLGITTNGLGGTLTVENGGDLSANSIKTDSNPGLTGTSSIEIQNGGTINGATTSVGTDNTASFTIDSGGTFNNTGGLYVGVNGSAIATADAGVGTLTNKGTLSASAGELYLGENTASGTFINQGGTTTLGGLTTNQTPSYNSPATLEMVGHTGSFTLSGGNTSSPALVADTAYTSLDWVFDSTGIALINLTKSGVGANISNATFNFDLSSAVNGTYILIQTNGGTITDTFGMSETVTSDMGPASSTTGTLFVSGGDLELTIGNAPEPGTWAMLLGGLGLLVMIQRRRTHQR